MRYSKRLEALANEIKQGETMADIGTDHGFLPVMLYERGISPKVIMGDVSGAALAKGIRHGKRAGLLDDDIYRVGNGLSVLGPGEVDVVVLAGMGGMLMTRILEEDIQKSRTFSRFVLQPRNYPGRLRVWLYQNGFGIMEETLVPEGRRICEILTVAPDSPGFLSWPELPWPEEDIRWEIPPWYARPMEPMFTVYLDKKLERENRVLSEIRRRRMGSNELEERRLERISYLESLKRGGDSHETG